MQVKSLPCKSCGGNRDSSLQRKALQPSTSAPKISASYGSQSFAGQSFKSSGGTSSLSKYVGRGK